MMRGDRWGLQGREDLGGGLRAVFRLESGFSLNNGVLGQSTATAQRIFGRYAYVGLANDKVQVLFGRQPDFMLDYLQTTANSWYGTSLEFHPAINANFFGNNGSNPSLDRIGGGEVDSSVKATWSPVESLHFGAMYGFGDAPGIGSPNSTQSYGATWTTTGALLGAVYTTRKDNLTPRHAAHARRRRHGIFRRFHLQCALHQFEVDAYRRRGRHLRCRCSVQHHAVPGCRSGIHVPRQEQWSEKCLLRKHSQHIWRDLRLQIQQGHGYLRDLRLPACDGWASGSAIRNVT